MLFQQRRRTQQAEFTKNADKQHSSLRPFKYSFSESFLAPPTSATRSSKRMLTSSILYYVLFSYPYFSKFFGTTFFSKKVVVAPVPPCSRSPLPCSRSPVTPGSRRSGRFPWHRRRSDRHRCGRRNRRSGRHRRPRSCTTARRGAGREWFPPWRGRWWS